LAAVRLLDNRPGLIVSLAIVEKVEIGRPARPPGNYGDYELTIGGKTYSLDLEKGVTDYTITVAEPSAALLAICGWATLGLIVSFGAETQWRLRAALAVFGTMIREA